MKQEQTPSDNEFIIALMAYDIPPASCSIATKEALMKAGVDKLVKKSIEKPLDFACSIHLAYEELEKEFDAKRQRLGKVIADVVMASIIVNGKNNEAL